VVEQPPSCCCCSRLSRKILPAIPYSQFEQLLDQNKISEVLVGSEIIKGKNPR
jgi:hypothetical protein